LFSAVLLQGQRLPSSAEQQWVWWLSLLLIPFNDPLFALQIFIPTVAASVFSGLMTVTFLATLLFFWLVHFHVAALQAEGGVHWELDGSRNRLGVVFWLPKAVLITLFWVRSFSSPLRTIRSAALQLLSHYGPAGDSLISVLV
jgi:hypothetical protein